MKLYNGLNHPVRIPYGDDVIVIPPQSVVKVEKPQLLGALPRGVMKLEVKKPNKKKSE